VTGVVALSGAEPATPAAQAPAPSTVAVADGPLASTVSLNGVLTYRARRDGAPYTAINQARGVYTQLPGEGDEVGCGDVLYRVDDDPVRLLCGSVPAYRDLGMGDHGKDVRQLNRNLHALGRDVDPRDDTFTWRTREALPSGALELGDAVVLPRAARIAKVTAQLGGPARPGTPVVQATSGTLEVQVRLEASQQGVVRRGDRARIALPGNRVVSGRVDRIGTVARTDGKDEDVGAATIPAYVRLVRPRKAHGLDRAPVRVDVTTRGVARALSVPVTALIGRAGGGVAVEVLRDGGRRDLVAVRLGLVDSASGRVQVTGGLAAGDHVVVPAS
jgi:hypothetical protein